MKIDKRNKQIVLAPMLLVASCCITILSLIYLIYYYPLNEIFEAKLQLPAFVLLYIVSLILHIITIRFIVLGKQKKVIIIMIIMIIISNLCYIEYFAYNRFEIETLVGGASTWYLMGFPIVLVAISTNFIKNSAD